MSQAKFTVVWLLLAAGFGMVLRQIIAPTEPIGGWFLVGFMGMFLLTLVGMSVSVVVHAIQHIRGTDKKKESDDESDTE